MYKAFSNQEEAREYAKIIEEFLAPIYELEINSEVSVKIGSVYIFFKTISVEEGNKTQPYGIDELEEIVEDMISDTPFKEDLY